MIVLLRRFLVLAGLSFWQGGFTFYAAVVVPVGSAVLDSHREQGFVTRKVTDTLNLAGACALLPLAWDVAVVRDRTVRRRMRAALWLGLALTLSLLVGMHPRLDALLDPSAGRILDGDGFGELHAWYLRVSTVQWCVGVAFLIGTLTAWRHEDGGVANPSPAA